MQKPLQKRSETNLKNILSPRVLWNGNGNTVDCICLIGDYQLFILKYLIIRIYISYDKNIITSITSLWAIKKIHVRLGISSCWHIFHWAGRAWATTCGTVRYFCHRAWILIDWRILKIPALNLERLNIQERFNISINRFISIRYFKLKQNIIDPLFGNSSLAFIMTGELFFNIGVECGAFHSLGFNQGRICYGIGTFCK